MEILEDLLEEARKLNASDLHITANQCVSLRIDGKLRKITIIVSIVFIIVCIALNVLALAFGM